MSKKTKRAVALVISSVGMLSSSLGMFLTVLINFQMFSTIAAKSAGVKAGVTFEVGFQLLLYMAVFIISLFIFGTIVDYIEKRKRIK